MRQKSCISHQEHNLSFPVPPPRPRIGAKELMKISSRSQAALSELRNALATPEKATPTLSSARVAKFAGITIENLNYRIRKNEIPPGVTKGNGRSREFTLEEAQEVVRKVGKYPLRQLIEIAKGVVIAVGNFKGGVGKTTNTAAIAQGLTLHGHRVLVVDLDPQASTTTMMGLVPTTDVPDLQTVMAIVHPGGVPDLRDAVVKTYWPNLDLIAASPALFSADFILPTRQLNEKNFEFWRILEKGLEPLRDIYDVILIDTPPTLSFMAIAAFMASDGLLVPIPPDFLDFASSTQFFRQFAELFESFENHNRLLNKEFDFIKIFLSRVKETSVTDTVRSWITATYPELCSHVEVPETDVVKNAAALYKTVYDVAKYTGNLRNFERVLDKFDDLVDEVEKGIQQVWQRQAAEHSEAKAVAA